ncbi:co-chaperone GroES [Sediminitomix flava]|uniref:Co-chaperonin GroES (HSP10) n=1 Tax=Sediminitomix flava TaxID=379075 RepID=A0A315ZDH9_SEDFL|nr:co-chaperone GroES family protein [Sediminitomix flava]PWJ43173.1 co-chaperonin GroES (HSP10) [Sediminitomix flava]
MLISSEEGLKKLVVIGDRVLIKPTQSSQTKSGLYLPPSVKENEKVQSGYVIKTGPGYMIPAAGDDYDEPWKDNEKAKYMPLQVKEGDLALFLQKNAIEVKYGEEKYFIVPQHSILMVERDEF